MAESKSKKVKTFEEYCNDHRAARCHSAEEKQALEGMFNTAKTKEQFTTVSRKAPSGSEIESKAIMKVVNMSEDMIALIQAAKLSDDCTELRKAIEKIMTKRAKTRDDWYRIYSYAECGSKLESLAYNKYHAMS